MPEIQSEQTFFNDPSMDRMFGVVMALATEVYVLKDRLAALEKALDTAGAVSSADLAAEPSAAEIAASAKQRDAFVAHLMDNLIGRQVSRSSLGGPQHGDA